MEDQGGERLNNDDEGGITKKQRAGEDLSKTGLLPHFEYGDGDEEEEDG